MKFRSIFTLVVLLMVSSLRADVYMKQRVTQDAFTMMGQSQPAQSNINEIWITADRIRTDRGTQTIIIDMKKNMMITLDHAEKAMTEMSLDISKAMMGASDASEEDKEGMQQMMQSMMQMKMTIQPTGEKQKIGQWNCQKYIQTLETMMGNLTTEIWASDEVKVDMEVYYKFAAAMMTQQPGLEGSLENMISEMKKIKGVTVLQKSSNQIMGSNINSTSELLEVKEQKFSDELFAIPDGYMKKSIIE
jgi:hypothetical protein